MMMRNILLFFTTFLFFSVFLSSCTDGTKTEISGLSVEYLSEPLGIDVENPRFSWKIYSGERDVEQSAWQIVAGESISDIKKGTEVVWDSGKNPGNENVNIEYAGNSLESNKKYYWLVRVWLNDGTEIQSKPSEFHTGILDGNEWQAGWITTQEEIINKSPLLRKEFTVGKKIRQAYVFVTACGFYELYLNGRKVGNHVLDPGVTDYRKTVLYSTYDVTSLLKKGVNAAGAMLGNGAWNLRRTEGRWSWGSGGSALGNPAFFMQLMISYSDGSSDMIVTDNSWKCADGPVTFNNLYGGEDYNAQKEIEGWADPGFDDSAWTPAIIETTPKGKLESQLAPAIEIIQAIEPVTAINPEPGLYLFDLGQNIAGWWRMEIKGSPGQVVRIRGSETLNDSLFSKPLEEGDRISTKHRYHSQVWTDYTMKGNGKEIYEPRFFYSGFRYIEVAVSDGKNPEYLKIQGRVVRSANKRNGRFESSDSLLNRIYRAGVWSQMGNMQSYPTDCPHREKGAYNGDGQVIAETSMHDFQMAPFYTKWLNDMRDSQQENGRIPNTSPVLVGGMGGGVAWGSAYILIPWWMNHYYGDTRILSDHYPNMKKYLQYLKELGTKDEDPSEPYIIDNFDGYWYSLGEWCAPGQSDCPNHPVVNTFYYYYNNLLMSEIAELLRFNDDSRYYKSLSDTIKQHFNLKFLNPETALYGTDETYQTYQLLALVGNLVPEEYREKVFQTITKDIKMRDNHLNTGIIGTKYLWPALVNGGENELAYKIATQTTYPGFGYWINNGSTTLLETWEGVNSHNHQMFGTITEYFFKFLAGIQSPMERNTGKSYKHIHLEPHVPQGLQYAKASLETVQGTITAEWRKKNDMFTYEVGIPANTTSTVVLPSTGVNAAIYEGDTKIWEGNGFIGGVDGIHSVTEKNGQFIVETGSGNYSFKVIQQ